ncbi:hypothetical protein RB195_013264 [Necator americanus]|uniref:Spaetzle domain-containing protein n=1 Tax=Necator americanus TaxID=51031 RepID=A0ABR1DVW7_NECAM
MLKYLRENGESTLASFMGNTWESKREDRQTPPTTHCPYYELEEDRKIMKERGLEEGRYRLQQHHKAHTSAVNKYCGQQQLVTVFGPGTWEVKENGNSYRVEESYCPCDKDMS